jgi:hypothetical protein
MSPHDLLEPPQAARRAAPDHVRMPAQIFQQRLGGQQASLNKCLLA